MYNEDARSALEDLLDNLELLADRKDDQRSVMSGSDVRLNIYDMMSINEYTSKFGIGVFHSGVEVYGKEYAYGGHPYSFTGVYEMSPRQEMGVAGQGGVQFKESLYIGHTSLNIKEVGELIKSMGKDYNGNVYHIFSKNCNHFSAELSYKLSGKNIPHWVNRLAYIGSWMPFVVSCLPPHWVTPTDPAIEDVDSDDMFEEDDDGEEEEQGRVSDKDKGGVGGGEQRRSSKDKDKDGRRGSKEKDGRRGSKDKEGRRGSKEKSGRKGSKDGEDRRGSREGSNGRKWSGGGGLFFYSMSASHSPAARRMEATSDDRTKENHPSP